MKRLNDDPWWYVWIVVWVVSVALAVSLSGCTTVVETRQHKQHMRELQRASAQEALAGQKQWNELLVVVTEKTKAVNPNNLMVLSMPNYPVGASCQKGGDDNGLPDELNMLIEPASALGKQLLPLLLGIDKTIE